MQNALRIFIGIGLIGCGTLQAETSWQQSSPSQDRWYVHVGSFDRSEGILIRGWQENGRIVGECQGVGTRCSARESYSLAKESEIPEGLLDYLRVNELVAGDVYYDLNRRWHMPDLTRFEGGFVEAQGTPAQFVLLFNDGKSLYLVHLFPSTGPLGWGNSRFTNSLGLADLFKEAVAKNSEEHFQHLP